MHFNSPPPKTKKEKNEANRIDLLDTANKIRACVSKPILS